MRDTRGLILAGAGGQPRPGVEPRYRFHQSQQPVRRSQLTPRAETPANAGDPLTAVLRVYDPIDSWGGDWGVSAAEFQAALDQLPRETGEIRLHLNSPGGEVFEAVAMLNALRRHPARVVAVVDGLAASAASFLAAGADETIMGRNTQLMIHDAWGLAMGNAAVMRDVADRLDHLSNDIAAIYAEKAGGTLEDWRERMLAETWLSADEAVAAKLADSVEGVPAEPDRASFDLSGFKHAGRENAPAPKVPTLAQAPTQQDTPKAPETDAPGVVDTDTARARHQGTRHKMNAGKLRS